MITKVSHSYKETEELAQVIGSILKGNEIIALFGDLGAGKTCFTRGLVRGLESDSDVSSPTFAIINEYQGKFPIFHFDMYRISSEDDLYSTGFYDYLENGVVIIEWSENIISEIDNNAIRIKLNYGNSENERIIEIIGLDNYEDIIN